MIRRKASFDISNVGTIIAGHFREILLADLAIETHIYEVDRLVKCHEGVGLVLRYHDDSGKQGVLVLILPDDYSDWV